MLLILVIILILEASFAFFSDYISLNIGATTGTVELKPVTFLINSKEEPIKDWKPGEVSTIEWTVENTGNKSVYTRSSLEIAWDTPEDMREAGVIYLYPVTMSDDEIRDDILNNEALKSISLGDDVNTIETHTNITNGFIYNLFGNVLDGQGFGAEETDSRTVGSDTHNLPDGTTTQKLRYKLAFSPKATLAYQNLGVYLGVSSEAIQFRNNEALAMSTDFWPEGSKTQGGQYSTEGLLQEVIPTGWIPIYDKYQLSKIGNEEELDINSTIYKMSADRKIYINEGY